MDSCFNFCTPESKAEKRAKGPASLIDSIKVSSDEPIFPFGSLCICSERFGGDHRLIELFDHIIGELLCSPSLELR